MWHVMASVQESYDLSERLLYAICCMQTSVINQPDSVVQLLDAGADVNLECGLKLPLHTACMATDSSTVEMLIDRGAQVNALDGYGRPAIHYAAERDLCCLRVLLDGGADPNQPDTNLGTALHWASFRNKSGAVRELLESGADVNATDYNDSTPLGWAAVKGNLDTIRVLLEYNANVDHVDAKGDSALSRACSVQASGINTPDDDAVLYLLIESAGLCELRQENGELCARLASDNRLSDMMLELCSNARSLQCLCRYQLRSILGQRYLPSAVYKLPLPNKLQQYLLLKT